MRINHRDCPCGVHPRISGFHRQEDRVKKMTLKEKLYEMRYRIALYSAMMMGLVSFASAGALNTSISDILYSMASLFPSLVSLVVAAVPVIIVISLAAFIVSFLNGIVNKLK